jgi:hypothetical protein
MNEWMNELKEFFEIVSPFNHLCDSWWTEEGMRKSQNNE